MFNQFHKVLCKTALGALVALGVHGAAQARLVVGVFDPDFGGSLPGTNFSGTATFSVDQKCLISGWRMPTALCLLRLSVRSAAAQG